MDSNCRVNTFNNALTWVKQYTINNNGITVTNTQKRVYPEVTGYYIPTLFDLGGEWKALATRYADYMCEIQKENGSWYDPRDIEPYVFDTCQILKGLVRACHEYPDKVKYHKALEKGSNWVLENMSDDGRLHPCRANTFRDQKGYSELIHIYCLSPLVEASKILNCQKYEKAATKCLDYYIRNFKDDILNFNLLAHFYAYVMEGLVDMGEFELAKQAMDKIGKLQHKDGMIPAYHNVDWTCSTALFQFAITWFKLGDKDRAIKAFDYGSQLQNKSGGWFGRYPEDEVAKVVDRLIQKCRISDLINCYQPNYFPDQEISWAVKFYLDAFLLAKSNNMLEV